uniref:Uncharacterized protein n=1 Tax=Rousettus aegyptiacus TaxID=9407 RepID=A0A7J8GBP0_ROUAE|nr:hypothetical protein HJG63_011771 [Rousettus aegyptiacus]
MNVSPKAAVPNLFGTRDRCSCENLILGDLRWSGGGNADAGEQLPIQTKLRSLTCRSPPAGWLGSLQAMDCHWSTAQGWGPPTLETVLIELFSFHLQCGAGGPDHSKEYVLIREAARCDACGVRVRCRQTSA